MNDHADCGNSCGCGAIADPAEPSCAAAADEPTETASAANEPPPKRKSEFTRKLMHMFPGVLPFILGATPHEDPLEPKALRFIIVLTIVLTIVFLACWRIVRRHGEKNLLSTVLSYPTIVLTALVLFPDKVEFTGVVVTVLALGDGSAYLAGRRFGRTRLPWNDCKTWVGTIAFVLVSGPLATLAYWTEARPDVPFAFAAACGFTAAIAGALAESLPWELTDNLRVGVAAFAGVVAAHFAFAGLFALA